MKPAARIALVVALIVVVAYTALWWSQTAAPKTSTSGQASPGWSVSNPFEVTRTKPPFPAVDTRGLTPTVAKHMAVLQQEYANPGQGTKYAQGVEEPWCADFVSWTFKQAGAPLKNPNSGSWRIPGTMTLLDHLRTEGRWKPASSGYQPKTGDIVIYDVGSSWGQHTNVVLHYRDGQLTTIGGNQPRPEADSPGISVDTRPITPALKILGYGVPRGSDR